MIYPGGDKSGWKMLIHDRLDSPVIDVRTHGTTLYRGWAKDIRVYIREVSFFLLAIAFFHDMHNHK